MTTAAQPEAREAPAPDPMPPPRPGLGSTLLLALVVVALASWEIGAALVGKRQAPRPSDLAAAAARVRASWKPGDLITVAPRFAESLGREQLGDLMPAAMVGRGDSRRYARIFELSLRGARADDRELASLTPVAEQRFGEVTLREYAQTPVTTTYDLVEHALDARVMLASPDGRLQSCPWLGPLPGPGQAQPRGPRGAFACPGPRIEVRTMEIDYRPRYGIAAELATAQRTIVEWDVPEAAWQGAKLVLFFGLHDYHARKNASGPAELVVDLDGGAVKKAVRVELFGGLQTLELDVPAAARTVHTIRIEASAASAPHHTVGILGELRR